MEVLSKKDGIVIASFDKTEKNTIDYFTLENYTSLLNVEIGVRDVDLDILVNVYHYKFNDFNVPKFIEIVPMSAAYQSGGIKLYTENILDSLGYIRGKYTVTYKFYFNILGNPDNKLFIKKISSSRKELVIDYVNKLANYEIFSKTNFYRFSQKLSFNKFLNFDNGENPLLILNAKNQDRNTLIIKLYQTLPSKYAMKDVFWVIEFVCEEISDTIKLDSSVKFDSLASANILKPPKYITDYDLIGTDISTYKTYNSLVDSSSLGDKYFSEWSVTKYLAGIDLDIKYENFENFVHFGSATQILDNFKNKLITIDYHNSKINESALAVASSASLYHKNKKSEIIGDFTGYEKFLYFESGSYFTSSLYVNASNTASQIDATYPKSGTSIANYTVYPTTSSYAQNWYATMSAVAFEYDYNNTNALVKTLPEYILDDVDNNQEYLAFVNMIGEFFDNIWHYTVAMQRMLKRENKFEDGVPGDLVWNILRNYGLNLNSGETLIDLNRYKYGYYMSASTAIVLERNEQLVTKQIWNRILNNYPYILKSKGTEKSIRALFNCYGLPNSLIQIQEFGGPSVTGSYDSSSMRKYSFDYDDFTFALEMTGSQYIIVPWLTSSYDGLKPDSIEFKFRTSPSSGNMDIFALTGSNGSFKLQLVNTRDDLGYLSLDIKPNASPLIQVTSSVRAFLNNEFYSIMVNRSIESDITSVDQNYYLNIKNYDEYIRTVIIDESYILPITSSTYNTVYTSATSFYLGGYSNSTQKFRGAFDEFRLWAERLTDRTFDFHCKYSLATNGNTVTSSLSSLAFRLPFNDAYNLYSTSSMLNEAFNTSSYFRSASAVGFVNEPIFPYNFSDYERHNTVEQSFIAADVYNNKIRIERNAVGGYIYSGSQKLYPLSGNYMVSDFRPIGEIGEFDTSPPDLDLLLIGFTPVDFINKDIIAFYGNNDILGVYGDFNSIYEEEYPKNTWLIDTYWENTKNPISFESYLDYIGTYNKSLFDVIPELVPAKATLILGTVYDQIILRRNKIKLFKPEIANNYLEYLFPVDSRANNLIDTIADNDSNDEGSILASEMVQIEDLQFDNYEAIIDESPCGIDQMLLYQFDEYVYRINQYGLKVYNSPYVNKQRYNIDKYRTFANSCKNSSLTTIDRGLAVIIKTANPKRLVVNYADIPKLIVKK